MSDPIPTYYQPDVGIASRTGKRPDPMTNVDKPIAMKVRMAIPKRVPNTKTKHYRRKERRVFSVDDKKRVFF